MLWIKENASGAYIELRRELSVETPVENGTVRADVPSRERRMDVAKDYQIGGWLRPDEKSALQDYLKQFGIRPAAAATLLIVRELRCKRLARLKERYAERVGTERSRLTAHQPDGKLKQAFAEHAAAFGMAPNPAASIVFRAELDERWLENAMESN